MKLNNLSRLTALLLALTIFLSSVAFADPVAEGDYTADNYAEQLAAQTGTCAICVLETEFPTIDHHGNAITITCGYEYLKGLGSPMERYNFLKYCDEQLSSGSLSALYSVHEQHVEAGAENLWCNCAEYWATFNMPGPENHMENCPWVDGTTIIIPNIPQPDPVNPDLFEQYTSNEEYDLPMAGDRAIILPEGGRAVIKSNQEAGYQWQVYDGTQWVSIQGETGADLAVTTAKLATIFDLTSIAELRYFDKANDVVKASVSVVSQEIAGGEYVEPVEEEAAPALYLIERDGENTASTYTIKVYYYYENTTTPVYREDSATYQAGQSANWTVTYPVLVGYEAWWMGKLNDEADDGEKASTSHTISIEALNENISYVVYYKPADVGFKVLHYLQNLEDDGYAEPIVETRSGRTNDSVLQGLSSKDDLIDTDYDENGFYALPFSTDGVIVAADGSTEVEIFYDRYYRLMNFELNGGYGVEPIYAKYETPISVGKPDRAGYTFVGWAATADGAADANLPPATMPAEHVTYYAVWQKNANATVTIVHWGENADDEGYSYLEDPSTTVTLPSDSEYIYGGATLTCTQEAHEHDDSCYKCGEEGHTHTEECYVIGCGQTEHTTHVDTCYSECWHECGVECYTTSRGTLERQNGEPSSNYTKTHIGNNIYTYTRSGSTCYALKLGNTWYQSSYGRTNSISYSCQHVHDEACLSCHKHDSSCYTQLDCDLHVHSAECLECTTPEHTHNADCFDNDPTYPVAADSHLYEFVRSDVVTVNPDGSTVVNVYWDRTQFTYTFYPANSSIAYGSITEKWGGDIYQRWRAICDQANADNWTVNEDGSQPWTSYIGIMGQYSEDYYAFSQSGTSTAYYYFEKLDGQYPTDTSDPKNPLPVPAEGTGLGITKEDIVLFEGFTFSRGVTTQTDWWGNSSDYEFTSLDNADGNYNGAKFYYTRHKYTLEFHNLKTNVTRDNIPFEMPLGSYDFKPDAAQIPEHYEPGSVQFAGWYLNPECTGEEFVLSDHTMPAGTKTGETTLVLYAKWEPVTYTVNFYLTDELYEAGEIYTPHKTDEFGMPMLYPPATFTVPHGDNIAPEYVEANLDYSAMVRDKPNDPYVFVYWKYWDAETEEWKAFNPTSPVRRSMDLIGVWSSNKLVNYEVTFVDQATGTTIAETISGQALAGSTKSFDAKGGTALYDSTESENGVNYQSGYFPIVPSHSITMDLLDETKNEFTFYYVKATAVPYKVYYLAETLKEGENAANYTQHTVDGKSYYMIAATQSRDNAKGESVVTETYVHVDGYLVDAYQKTLMLSLKADENGNYVPNADENVIYFFYEVNEDSTSYKVIHYKEVPQGTDDAFLHDGKYWVIHQEDTKPGEYGVNVAETDLDIPYYKYDSTVSGTKTSGTPERDADQLVLKFYYTEDEATINYVPVGPTGIQWDTTAGTVCVTNTTDATTETVKKVTGEAFGATATPATNVYKFVGWYDNAACEGDPISTDAKFVPTKTTEQVWPETSTYYAKFDWNMGSLKITKTGLKDGESAIFKVEAESVTDGKQTYYIILSGNDNMNSATITNLKANSDYTITEQRSWSWSYTPNTDQIQSGTIEAGGTKEHTFTNEKVNKWLHDENGVINDFSKTSGTDVDNN